MKIHEYQAKELLKKYHIPIQDGVVCESENQIESSINEVSTQFNTNQFVVKAQIHAGGRGKGGGVKFCPNKQKAIEAANTILGMQLITHQTGEEGQKVQKIMIAEALDIAKEFYLAITLDRSKGMDVVMASTEGGVEIEEVAEKTPEKIIKAWIDPAIGMQAYQARQLAFGLKLDKDIMKQAIPLFINLYNCYRESDASIAEINPLVITDQNKLIALDAKFNFDSNALYRQKNVIEMMKRLKF